MTKTESQSVVWSIQYLRAAAAIAVVVFHQLQARSWIFRIGEHGVDMFFVISGFIMFVQTDGRNVMPINFALDRIARIVPPYWLATGVTFLLAAMGVRFYNSSYDVGLLIRSLLFIPARNGFGAVYPTLYLGWTLAFEMFFYSIFAAVLFAGNRRVLLLATILGALFGVGVVVKPQTAIALTYTSPLLLEFLAGVLLGKIFGIELHNEKLSSQIVGTASIACVLALASPYYPELLFGALSALTVGGSLLLERCCILPKIKQLRQLGDASFAIYLFQEFAFEAVQATVNAAGNAMSYHYLPRGIGFIKIVAAICFGMLVLRYVERPLTKATKRALRRLSNEPVRLATSPITDGDPGTTQ